MLLSYRALQTGALNSSKKCFCKTLFHLLCTQQALENSHSHFSLLSECFSLCCHVFPKFCFRSVRIWLPVFVRDLVKHLVFLSGALGAAWQQACEQGSGEAALAA